MQKRNCKKKQQQKRHFYIFTNSKIQQIAVATLKKSKSFVSGPSEGLTSTLRLLKQVVHLPGPAQSIPYSLTEIEKTLFH